HVLPLILKDAQLADILIIVSSIDPCLSCTDRVAITDAEASKPKIFTKEELTRLSYEKTWRMRV
ncbi:MAG TPA: NADH dehydrogenase subunit, partial [Methanocorpusculum sp.]|nr:NADH dehydrogenase subunit [Methanocorpusculum sp.]